MKKYEYKKQHDPYTVPDDDLVAMEENHTVVCGNYFYSPVVPVKGQTWLDPKCPAVTAIMHSSGEAWALRVEHKGDPCGGHIGTAFAPFVSGHTYLVAGKPSGQVLKIDVIYVHPVKKSDGWYWRVEFHLETKR